MLKIKVYYAQINPQKLARTLRTFDPLKKNEAHTLSGLQFSKHRLYSSQLLILYLNREK